MKRNGFFPPALSACLLAVFLAVTARPVFAETGTFASVAAEGMAIKTEDKADYKKKALQDAHKNAVAAAIEKVLLEAGTGGERAAVEAKLLPEAASFILTYKVLSEGWLTHTDIEMPTGAAPDKPQPLQGGTGVEAYHVRIEAGVDGARLRAAIDRIASEGVDTPLSETMTITLMDVPDYKAYSELLASIEKVGLIKDLVVNSFYRGRVVLSAATKGDERPFIERLAKELSEGYTVIPGSRGEILIRPTAGRKGVSGKEGAGQ